jgi:hypothetical protein
MACQYLIPLITDNIHSIRLSNDDDTPQQIDLFLSLFKFSHLQSLSLHSMHSESTINRMMIEWPYLTHLNITNCQVLNDWNIGYTLIDNIWSLPKLTHCQLDINVIGETYFIVPTVISLTLESLSIKNMHCDLEELISLFEYTPRLRYLDIIMNEENVYFPPLSFSVPLITTLKITYEGPFSTLENLLESVPNLSHLTMRTKHIAATGKVWEQIISNYLPKLRIFRLLMEFYSPKSFFLLTELISAYKSDFWLKEHQWYIRCDSYRQSNGIDTVFLYTLPYAFNDYSIHLTYSYALLKPNFSNSNDQFLYRRVHHLSCTSLSPDIYHLHHRFYHIYHLVLKLPFNNSFWTSLPTFDQLRILDISFSYMEAYDKVALFQLQTLLDQAPKLYSLMFKSSIDLILPLLECTSESIIKLDFQTSDEYFDDSNCSTLFLSTLGKQCQILSIKVHDPMNILQLLKEMPQLHTLNIELPSDKYKTDNDQLIKWLRRQLSSTCMITRDLTYLNRIQLWIR